MWRVYGRHEASAATVNFKEGEFFYGGRNIWNQTVLKQLVTSFVLSRIDYCNSLLINLPTSTIAPLQRVQNAARLVLGLDRRAYTGAKTTTLVASSIQFKIATPMHQIYHRHCPQYLVNLVSFTSDAAGQRLRSTATRAAVLVRTRTNLGRRAFQWLARLCGTAYRHHWDSLTVINNFYDCSWKLTVLMLHFRCCNLTTF